MLPKEKINRINALSQKSKRESLSSDEKKEQLALREEYLNSFRQCFKEQLERIKFVDDDENESSVEKNKENK